ncbi:hypothetical protein V2A60_001322 [Cordyceps javanica]|uniref:Uncharacterized protein n=1 Tax=Cordyceps javanica TaxID=43265 RepID=A0A545VER6_9HYPO|nr:hypothetical protein IF1G_00148 [Cordyceps javanica]TQW11416.1 mucin, catalytic, TM and cytoplasmic tail region domain-containing protein [Cordyceps javanica]
MSTTEPPPSTTATVSATPTPTSSPSDNKLQPITYVVIPLVTLASVFLVGLFAYFRRRRSLRLENGGGYNGDGGESQMQERRRSNAEAADRWPPASLGFNWWFMRSSEGLNELGEAPPPYDVKRRKAMTEGSASATDEDAGQERDAHVQDEENEGDESRHGGDTRRESASHGIEETMVSSNGENRGSIEEVRRIAQQQLRRSDDTPQTRNQAERLQNNTPHIRGAGREEEVETRGPNEHAHTASEPPSELGPPVQGSATAAPALYRSSSETELPLLLSDGTHRRQSPDEIHALIAARLRRNQRRRERQAARAASASANPTGEEDQYRDDVCTTEFFRAPSPESNRRRIERLNRRLRRLGYVTSDTTEHYGFQLRDMEDGASPPDYERDPAVTVPPPAQLPPPLAADAPPPYPMPVRRPPRREPRHGSGPPMVRQSLHEHFPHHNYLFMPPLEHDYLVTSFSATLDMPRHLHSRF